jgi:hypothetical protein
MNLRIEEPCHENWNAMTQQEKGRHCDKCCKTVFDFTKMPTEEVIQFIASRKKDSVCGRFTAGQVQVPSPVKVNPKISWTFKKFLAALVLVFGGALFTGCGNEPMGKLIDVDSTTSGVDSTTSKMGAVLILDTVIPKTNTKDTVPPKKDPGEKMLKGKVSCDPVPKEEVYYNGGVSIVEPPTIVGLTVIDIPPADTLK